ncbi:MAG: hypothetical protein QXF12_01890 [Candidatus Aenigmatarchaeota archaeon]
MLESHLSYNVINPDAIYYNGISSISYTYYYEEEGNILSKNAFCPVVSFSFEQLDNPERHVYNFIIRLLPSCDESIEVNKVKKIEVYLYSGQFVSVILSVSHESYNGHLTFDEYLINIVVETIIDRSQQRVNVFYSQYDFRQKKINIPYEKRLYKADYLSNNYNRTSTAVVLDRWLKERSDINRNTYTFSYADLANNNNKNIKHIFLQDRNFVFYNKSYTEKEITFTRHNKVYRYSNIILDSGILYGYINHNNNISVMSSVSNFINNSKNTVNINFTAIDTNDIENKIARLVFLEKIEYSFGNNDVLHVYLAPWFIHNRDGTDYPNRMLYEHIKNNNNVSDYKPVFVTSGFSGAKQRFFYDVETQKTFLGDAIPTGKIMVYPFITPFIRYSISKEGNRKILRLHYIDPIKYEYHDMNYGKLYHETHTVIDVEKYKMIAILGLDYDKVIFLGNRKQDVTQINQLTVFEDAFVCIYNFSNRTFNTYKINYPLYTKSLFLLGSGGGYLILSIADLNIDESQPDVKNVSLSLLHDHKTFIPTWHKLIKRVDRYEFTKNLA